MAQRMCICFLIILTTFKLIHLSCLIYIGQVKVLKLYGVHPRCLPPVLNVFGSALESLHLESCPSPIDLGLLTSCIALEDLSIFHCIVICEGNDPSSRWTSETFLPSLNSLVTYKCCLGVWASLLETKSTMMHLHLDCVHIGTSVGYYFFSIHNLLFFYSK